MQAIFVILRVEWDIATLMVKKRVMLHITLMSTFCAPIIDMALKITIRSKSNSGLS
jgi:hypothetical protein